MKFQIVDAFSENLFGGNPAGVVLLDKGSDFPSDEIMIKTAAELRYSETAFIKILENSRFHIRYFTPVAEVDLCGHATIGSFVALQNWGLVKDKNSYTILTLAGELDISIVNGTIFMQMGKAEILKTIDNPVEIERIANILAIDKSDIILPINIVSTGLADIMLEVSSFDVLNKIRPDFAALSNISEEYNVTGLHAAYFKGENDLTAHCRNFAPLYDIDEEAATGTASGAITYHLYSQNKIKENSENIFIQGESMNRPSKIISTIKTENGNIKIEIGGTGCVLASGEIHI
ncbi:MAG: PhzF family phenazine biosynthesis protein [Eubacteriales bacterium]